MTELAEEFQSAFGAEASFFVRAPGRFNLIGEHVDYSSFPVFPQAINYEIAILVALQDDPEERVVLQASESSSFNFPKGEFKTNDVHVSGTKEGHVSYFKASLSKVLERQGTKVPEGKGIRLLVTSNLPPVCSPSSYI